MRQRQRRQVCSAGGLLLEHARVRGVRALRVLRFLGGALQLAAHPRVTRLGFSSILLVLNILNFGRSVAILDYPAECSALD